MDLYKALRQGDPAIVRSLIESGADIHYRREHGYAALIDAVHGRDIRHDPKLLDLLTLLIEQGVDLDATSSYGESAMSQLSFMGRFDAIAMLIEAGADPQPLQWTRLMEAVALGTLADVRRLIATSPPELEIRDRWSRTPWMVALLIGDIDKATLLMESGADINAVDHVHNPALFHAIKGGQPHAVRWLLQTVGVDLRKPQQLGASALRHAAQYSELECINILLDAGADATTPGYGSPLYCAETREIALRLLDAGADPSELQHHVVLGWPDPDEIDDVVENPLDGISEQQFLEAKTCAFGTTNPERQNFPFWLAMIRAGVNAYRARTKFYPESPFGGPPVWCAQRYGQSLTLLPDGRAIRIAGEHEDSYDPDFCIYNDVFVHHPDGTIDIYGYPKADFPPTDFHTATLIDHDIYIIGNLGYPEQRKPGTTPVYRLNTTTMRIERIATTGKAPGWIHKHNAEPMGTRAIRIRNGEILRKNLRIMAMNLGKEVWSPNKHAYTLDLPSLTWRIEPETP